MRSGTIRIFTIKMNSSLGTVDDKLVFFEGKLIVMDTQISNLVLQMDSALQRIDLIEKSFETGASDKGISPYPTKNMTLQQINMLKNKVSIIETRLDDLQDCSLEESVNRMKGVAEQRREKGTKVQSVINIGTQNISTTQMISNHDSILQGMITMESKVNSLFTSMNQRTNEFVTQMNDLILKLSNLMQKSSNSDIASNREEKHHVLPEKIEQFSLSIQNADRNSDAKISDFQSVTSGNLHDQHHHQKTINRYMLGYDNKTEVNDKKYLPRKKTSFWSRKKKTYDIVTISHDNYFNRLSTISNFNDKHSPQCNKTGSFNTINKSQNKNIGYEDLIMSTEEHPDKQSAAKNKSSHTKIATQTEKKSTGTRKKQSRRTKSSVRNRHDKVDDSYEHHDRKVSTYYEDDTFCTRNRPFISL